MKIFKNKNFKALIYSIFLSLPILTILGRTIYTIANKNAKDSYYGETINERQEIQYNYDNLVENENYYFENVITQNMSNDYGNDTRLYVEDVVNLNGFNNNVDLSNTYRIRLYLTATYNALNFEDVNGNTITSFNEFNLVGKFSFTYKGFTGNQQAISYYNYFYQTEYNKYSYLDNAFEYSIDKFTTDNNFGKLNFFQWFSDLFLNNNQTNNLYIHFVNWYMNYILYVSLAYLLFAVLMWFVNFFRSLVEKNMDLDL